VLCKGFSFSVADGRKDIKIRWWNQRWEEWSNGRRHVEAWAIKVT